MKNFLNKLTYAIRRFMYGRYGMDQLGYLILVTYMVLLVIFSFWRSLANVSSYILIVILLIFYFRIMSKNIYRRSKENAAFLRIYNPLKKFVRKKRMRVQKLKEYSYFRCPQCKNELRVPRGKGKIEVTCPKCRHRFDRKS